MIMELSSKQNEFYIDLDEERNFYHGETIAGSIVLDLHKETRTSNIKVALIGTVTINDKPVVIHKDEALLARNPNGSDRSHILHPHTHRFRFSFKIPLSKSLPSTLNIQNAVTVKYRVIATHHIVNLRFIDMKKFSPTIFKTVNIFERIDVESSDFGGAYSQTREVAIVGEHRKSNIIVKLPKRAAVKGDIIQINVDIDHISTLIREKGVVANLVQYVYSIKSKSQLQEPTTLASANKKIVISSPTDFSTSMDLNLHIPRNISPTVEAEKSSIFRIEYLVQIEVNLNDQSPKSPGRRTDFISFDLPFTIGTYSRSEQCIEDDNDNNDNEEAKEEELNFNSDSAISDQVSDTISSLSVGSNNAPQDRDDPKQQQYDSPIVIPDASNNYNRRNEIKPDEIPSTPKKGRNDDDDDDDSQLPVQIQDLNNHQPSIDWTIQSSIQPELPIQITSAPSPQIPAQMSPSLGSVYVGLSRASSVIGSIHRRSTQTASNSIQGYLPVNSTQAEYTQSQLPMMISSPVSSTKRNATVSHSSRPNNPALRVSTGASRSTSSRSILTSIITPESMSPTIPISQAEAFHWAPPSSEHLPSPHIELHQSYSDSTQRYSQNHYQRNDHLQAMMNHNYTNTTTMPTPMPYTNNNNNYHPMSPASPITSFNNYPQRHPSTASIYPVHPQPSEWPNDNNYPVNSQPPVHIYMPEPNTGY